MAIQNFPAALQPIIQQGFLEREFQQALRSRLGYRAVSDREEIAVGIGETLTKTRAGLKPTVTTPLSPATNTNLDNGLSATTWGVEQYTLTINHYAATTDLNMVTSRVGIASQFLQNAYTNGEQAARSLDELARNALFGPYFGGNTRVATTLGAGGPSIEVDDIRGFTTTFVNGVPVPVTGSATLSVTVGAGLYTLIGAAADAVNTSTAGVAGGASGTLTFSSNVSVFDGTAGNTVTSAGASVIVRPAGRANTALLTAGDTLTMSALLDAVAKLRMNAVPEIDGVYNCYLDPVSARQLFADADFRQLFQGATSANQVFRQGVIIRNTPGTGVDVWLDGTQVATAAPNVMPASATAQLLFLHSGSSSGGAQCWFHEAATWERALSSGDIATLLSCATRWPRGARKGIAIVPIGQSNCGNALGDGAWNVMVQGIAWHLGAVSWNVVGKYGSDGSSTCTAGRGLYGGSEATYNGTYLTYVAGADPSTWALGADGTGVGVWINQSVLAADKADIAAILLPWSETDSIRPYSEKSLYMGAMKQFISLMRASLGKTAAQFPIFWWNAIPYSGGSTGGMQMVRETAAALAADPTQNVVITMPQTSDSNSRGATWNATTGAQSGGDSEHRDAPDNITFGRRAAVVAARALITAGVYDTLSSIPTGLPVVGGPSIVSAHLATSTTVVVTIVHDAGTDLIVPLMAAQGDGWALMENGSVATPGTMIAATACVRSSPTTLTLTLASPVTAPGANCLLFYPYGTPTMSRGNAVTDNYASLTRPAGWDIGHDLGSAWTFNWPLAATFTPIAMT